MKVLYAIVASKHILSQVTNAMTIVEVIEHMTFQGLPEELPPDPKVQVDLSFVVLHDATGDGLQPDQVFPGSFYIDTPVGKILNTDVQVTFKDGKRALTIIQSQAMPYVGEGVYTFTLKCGDLLATWPIDVSAGA